MFSFLIYHSIFISLIIKLCFYHYLSSMWFFNHFFSRFSFFFLDSSISQPFFIVKSMPHVTFKKNILKPHLHHKITNIFQFYPFHFSHLLNFYSHFFYCYLFCLRYFLDFFLISSYMEFFYQIWSLFFIVIFFASENFWN
jgi:hypothetical protein